MKDEIAKAWRMRKGIVVPVIIRVLGAVSVNFKEYMKRIAVNVRLEVIQKTALFWTAKILRKVLILGPNQLSVNSFEDWRRKML